MQTLLKTFRTIFEKKIFVIYISVFVLITSLLNLMNPLPALIKGIFNELSGNWIDNMIVLINNIMNRNTILSYMLMTFAISLGLAIVLSAIFSGLLYLLSKTVDDPDFVIKRFEFVKGFLHYFVHLAMALFSIIYLILLLIFSFMIMIFPTLMVGKITGTHIDGDFSYEFYIIITLIVMYLLTLFLRMYLVYMIPACFKTTDFLRISLKVAGSSFIRSISAFVLIDLFYVGMLSFLMLLQSGFWKFLMTFIMNTSFWTVVIVWLFYHFNHTIIKKNIALE